MVLVLECIQANQDHLKTAWGGYPWPLVDRPPSPRRLGHYPAGGIELKKGLGTPALKK